MIAAVACVNRDRRVSVEVKRLCCVDIPRTKTNIVSLNVEGQADFFEV